MSVRLELTTEIAAEADIVWQVLIDWEGQSRWIPLTTLRVETDHRTGLGVRVAALSGVWLGRVPLGLLDRFIVTGWSPPVAGTAELEILHLGPYFTGEGVFRLAGHAGGTTVTCVEVFSIPGPPVLEIAARAALPVMRAGFARSLRALGEIAAAV
jgi:uncharacterized protein YndB with AHSA1/START domain